MRMTGRFPWRRAMSVLVVAVLLAGAVGGTSATAAELVVIANPDLPVERIASQDLQRIFLGKLTRWGNDEAVVPVVLKDGPVHESFVTELLDRSPHRFVTYWRQMVFTGRGRPPHGVANEREMVAFVAETPGAVGYVSDRQPRDGVKILVVDGR